MEPGGTARGNASAGAATASSISVDQPSTLTSIDLRIAQLEAELDESSSSSPEGESSDFSSDESDDEGNDVTRHVLGKRSSDSHRNTGPAILSNDCSRDEYRIKALPAHLLPGLSKLLWVIRRGSITRMACLHPGIM